MQQWNFRRLQRQLRCSFTAAGRRARLGALRVARRLSTPQMPRLSMLQMRSRARARKRKAAANGPSRGALGRLRQQPVRRSVFKRLAHFATVRFVPSRRSCEFGASALRRASARARSSWLRLFRPRPFARDRAWVAVAASGTVGIVLTFLLQLSSSATVVQTRPKRANAPTPAVEAGPPGAEADRSGGPTLEPAYATERQTAELPPNLEMAEDTADMAGDESPAFEGPLPAEPPQPEAELEIALSRIAPPAHTRTSALSADSEQQFLVRSDRPLPSALLRSATDATAGESTAATWDGPDAESIATNAPVAWLPFSESKGKSLGPERVNELHRQCVGEGEAIDAESETPEITSTEPGPKDLNITVEKTLPAESALHEVLTCEIVVRNEGDRVVDRLRVQEQLPDNHLLADVSLPATIQHGRLVWILRRLSPGAEKRLQLTLIPVGTGSAAALTHLAATAAVTCETMVAEPQLELSMTLPKRIRVGGLCPICFRIANRGRTEASEVVLRTDLPEQLTHPQGRKLDYDVGTLAPGETRELRLMARADRAGSANHHAELAAAGFVVVQSAESVEIARPETHRLSAQPETVPPHAGWMICP